MPARTTSNARSSSVIMQHDSASDFLAVAYPTLRRHEASSNIVLAHALKRVSTEAALSGYQFTSDADVDTWLAGADASSFAPHPTNGAFWLTLWSSSPGSHPTLDIVLSCVDWTLGNYPIFLWSPKRPSEHSSAWLQSSLVQIADHLRQCVGPERVYSVFGMTSLVKTFTRYWSHITGFRIEPEPFYAAYFSFCNANTFKPLNAVLPTGHRLRRAMISDLEQVAQLCKEFADDSVCATSIFQLTCLLTCNDLFQVYFPLSIDRARIEARELISKGQIWVYDANGSLTTICAVTRNTHRVSAITKVFTTPRWRRRGCAEFLVRYVTAQ